MIKLNSEFIFTKKIGLLTPTHSLGKKIQMISFGLPYLFSWDFCTHARDIFRVVPQWGHDVGGHVHQLAEVA